VADLRSKLTTNGNFNSEINGAPTASGPFSAQEKSTFLGAGPRLGVVGNTPLGGAWSFDWLAGAAVLFGERRLQRQASAATPTVTVISLTNSDSAAVFNLDAEAGLSYWLNANMKVTASFGSTAISTRSKHSIRTAISSTSIATTKARWYALHRSSKFARSQHLKNPFADGRPSFRRRIVFDAGRLQLSEEV